MVDRPETRYAWNGDVALAYQVVGEGAVDLIYLQGYCSHVDMNWESPYLSRFLRGLAKHARVIVTDRRGWGCSDRFSPADVPPLETLADDLIVLMDTTGSQRAAVFASWECAIVAALFAATYPDRASALILCDPFVTYAATDETPWMYAIDRWEEVCAEVHDAWGTPAYDPLPDKRENDWHARYQRASIGPGALIAETRRFLEVDVRDVLPTIHAPTLIISPLPGDGELWNPENGRLLSKKIRGARVVELPTSERAGWHHWYDRADAVLREAGRFLVDLREEEAAFDRVLSTVLFTDIAGSTEKAAAIGDRGWRELLERHHAIVRSLLARYRGVEMDTAGDGFYATFDGPARAIKCAQAIVDAVATLGIHVRAGVHTGECQIIDHKFGGLTVAIGARIGSMAAGDEILVSQTVRDLVAGAGIRFGDRGVHQLKGVPGDWRVWSVAPRN